MPVIKCITDGSTSSFGHQQPPPTIHETESDTLPGLADLWPGLRGQLEGAKSLLRIKKQLKVSSALLE